MRTQTRSRLATRVAAVAAIVLGGSLAASMPADAKKGPPSPTPTPTASPSASPAASPTASPKPSPTPSPSATASNRAPALALPLSVQGNRIVDANGATVVLRGLQRDGTQGGLGASTRPVTQDELGWIGYGKTGAWHARLVRVPLGSAQWTGACPELATDPAGYRAQIDAIVQGLTNQGIVALVDLHTSTAGCTSIARHAMPDAPVSQQFWADVAAHYRSNPLVAFELYNEPHFVPDVTWLQGTADASVQDCDVTAPLSSNLATRTQQQAALARCQASSPRYRAAGMQELYDIVVTNAPGHLVVADGPGWASTPSGRPINAWRGGLVHGMHPYTCPVPGATCNTTTNAVANLALLDKWLNPSGGAPVLVTEMGWPVYARDDGTANYVDGAGYYRDTIAYLQRQSPPWGFVAFAFDGSARGSFSLISDTTTYLPNSTGRPVYDFLRTTG